MEETARYNDSSLRSPGAESKITPQICKYKIKFVEGEYEQTIESDCEFSNKI